MPHQSTTSDLKIPNWGFIFLNILVFIGLYLTRLYNYLLFHTLIEMYSIVVAYDIFIIAWNSRRFLTSHYLLFIGIVYLFVGGVDMLHTMAYKGMGIFPGYDANLPTQLWIAARYLESFSLLIAPLFLSRKLNPGLVIVSYMLIILILVGAIFSNIFPDCFIEGAGLTFFKKASEYIISLLFTCSLFVMYQKRDAYDKTVLRFMSASVFVTIASELSFTLYADVYGVFNAIGHFFKIISFYLIYKAIVETGLKKPYALMFRELKQSEEKLAAANQKLEKCVENQTAELLLTNECLKVEVAERKQAQESLQESQAVLQAILDNAPVIIFMKDFEGRYVLINKKCETVLGLRNDDIKGRTTHEILPRELADQFVANDENVMNADVPILTEEHIPWDGSLHTMLSVQFQIRDARGRKKAICVISTDITERKRMEEELRQHREHLEELVEKRTAELTKANEWLRRENILRMQTESVLYEQTRELERSNEELEQFAYVASHDLQEPLRMISGYLNLLKRRYEGKLDTDADEFIAFATDGAQRMQMLINDLLALSRITTRKKPFAPVETADILRQALSNLSVAVTESNARITHDTLPCVMGDDSQLLQVFQNLIANGIKFCKEKPPRIHIAVKENNKEWVFSFKDNGIGIASEYYDRIFVIFQRLHGRDDYPGTGIGLSICKKIIEHHGGRIWVESQENEGTVFSFTLPIAKKNGKLIMEN